MTISRKTRLPQPPYLFIRYITIFSLQMITANCAPIVRKDQEATNGLVHLVDSFLDPILPTTVDEALANDGRFVQFERLINESLMQNDLKTGGPYTIFAPYDEAFQNYPSSRLERIRSDPVSRRGKVFFLQILSFVVFQSCLLRFISYL